MEPNHLLKRMRIATVIVATALVVSVAGVAVGQPRETQPPQFNDESQQEQHAPDITSVSVDGVQYSVEDFTQLFLNQPLHWVGEPEAEAQGALVAFTSEEKRDAAYGVQPRAGEEAASAPEDILPRIYDGLGFRGRSWIVRRSIANLGTFNGLTSSAFAPGRRGLILYDNFNFRHCSFAVPGQSGVVNLGRYPLFCSVGGTWDNQTSSVRLW